MGIVIRIDDYPGTKENEFGEHNFDNFVKFDEVMQRIVGKRYLLGVIPRHTSDEEIDKLSKMNLIIGMHGVTHDERRGNEMPDYLTYTDIVERLRGARRRLLRLKQDVDVYLPPHNILDQRTINALQEVGFKAFTTGPETDRSLKPMNLTWIHSQPPFEYGRSDELIERGAVEHLLAECGDRTVCLTLHWPWEWNIGLSWLEIFLEKISDHVIDF